MKLNFEQNTHNLPHTW